MKLRKEHITILIILITEVLGFSLILPFLPFYAQEFNASPLVIGLLLTTFSFFQFLTAPIMGKLSDQYGRKPLLLISQFSTFIGFLILGFANSLWMLFLSRIVDGLFGSNFTIAQAYLSDISSKKERSKAFGISGVAFGFGFLVGPGLGGFLSQFSFQLPSFLAAGVSLVTLLIIFLFLPETIKRKEKIKFNLKIFHFSDFRRFLSDSKLSSKLWAFFTYIFSFAVWISTFALYAQKQLGFNATDIGYSLTYIGFLSIIIRGVLLSKMINFFGEKRLKYIGVVSIIIGMIGSAFVFNWLTVLIIMTLFSFGSGISRPVLLGEISRNVSAKKQGSAMGVANSLVSIAQIIGPLIGGFIINYFIPGILGIISAIIIFIGLLLMIREDIKS
ncbi:MAG: MFS transporter [Candidatus Aenigmarchaeota archaeon]|nr:MFS transporter [Candidatus Aenigmarchaeota archaeon]